MPKKMLWTELLFSYFPIDEKMFWQQMLARFCLLFSVWLIGFLAYALDGLMASYIISLNAYAALFGVSFLILFGSYMISRTQDNLIQNIRPMLKLDDLQFQKFHEKVQRYSYNFLPCLLMAIGLVVFTSGALDEFQLALAEGFRLHVIWNLFFYFFTNLLTATAIWMFMSIWLTIFLISRQPLSVKLSPETIEKFRGLNMVALWIALFYFLGVSIGIVTFSAGIPAPSIPQIFVSPYLFFITIGIIGILLPFYNIHQALLKLKKQELLKIKEESEQLLQQLDRVFAKQPTKQNIDQVIAIMARLFSLQFKEKHAKAAQEWPIDINFLSKLIGLGLIPIVGRIVAEIFTRYF